MNAHDAETREGAISEFEKAVVCLRLELPDLVWRDVWRRWMDLRRQFDGDVR
jgi:hypothetical protein